MAVHYMKDGEPFQFDSGSGFPWSGSAKGNVEARQHPPNGNDGGGTYVERARGGPIRKAAGGDIQQQTLAAPGASFNQAFAAARRQAMSGGPKTFEWNGRAYTTDLAPTAPAASTGRAHMGAPAQAAPMPPQQAASTGRAHAASEQNFPTPPIPPDYTPPSQAGTPFFSRYSPDRESDLQRMRETDALRAQQGQSDNGMRSGGRVRRAVGGAIMPGAPSPTPPMGAMPSGVPGGTSPAPAPRSLLSNATITMPVQDAGAAVARAVRVGHAIGQHQSGMRGAPGGAIGAMPPTPAAAMPPPAGAPGMAHGGKFIQGAIKHPGRMEHGAAREGVSTHEYMVEHEHSPGSLGSAARMGLRLTGGDLSPRKKK